MKFKQILIEIIILAVIMLAFVWFRVTSFQNAEQNSYQIIDKAETEDKRYLVLAVEVSPEEYIGYDIGDNYEVNHD